ncbi:MAG: hypothetical protein QM803_10150 [Rhodocyclaceae bacterium]
MNQTAGRYLAWSVVLAVTLVVAGAVLFSLSQQALQAARREQASAANNVAGLRARFARTEHDEPAIRDAIARFSALRAAGIIGTERRLDWADSLASVRTVRRIPLLEYEILPQRALRPLGERGEYELTTSPMRLHLGLLHEGDLLRVLDDIRRQPSARVAIRECAMTRAPAKAGGGDENISLLADCTLDWLTIQKKAASEPLAGTTR